MFGKQWGVSVLIGAICMLLLPWGNVQAAKAADGVHIKILHTNDMHARVRAGDDYGKSIGMAEIAAAIRQAKTKDADTLAMDAGDTLHGMPIVNVSRGENMVKLMNAAGYDCMVPGNHDYNYGAERLQELAKQLDFPVLSANTVDRRTKKLLFSPYETMTVDGVKIAVFGLTTPETAYKAKPELVEQVEFLDPIETAKQMVKKLRQENDVLIAVTHIGLDKSSVITSGMLADKVKGIDLIIDGHSHTELPQGLTVGSTLIAQTGCHDWNLGEVELVVKDHKVIKATAHLYTAEELKKIVPQPDAAVTSLIAQLDGQNKARFDEVVAYSKRSLSAERAVLRTQEAELGDICADAIRWAAKADIGLINAGSIRQDIKAGLITRGNLMAICPFGNTLQKLSISGAVLKDALEYSVEQYPAVFGGFLQVSGIEFDMNPAMPAGQRVSNLRVQGRPVVLQKDYTVAINDFLAGGGDGYTMLKKAKVLQEYGTMEEIIAEYLNQADWQNVQHGRIHKATADAAAEKAA